MTSEQDKMLIYYLKERRSFYACILATKKKGYMSIRYISSDNSVNTDHRYISLVGADL